MCVYACVRPCVRACVRACQIAISSRLQSDVSVFFTLVEKRERERERTHRQKERPIKIKSFFICVGLCCTHAVNKDLSEATGIARGSEEFCFFA